MGLKKRLKDIEKKIKSDCAVYYTNENIGLYIMLALNVSEDLYTILVSTIIDKNLIANLSYSHELIEAVRKNPSLYAAYDAVLHDSGRRYSSMRGIYDDDENVFLYTDIHPGLLTTWGEKIGKGSIYIMVKPGSAIEDPVISDTDLYVPVMDRITEIAESYHDLPIKLATTEMMLTSSGDLFPVEGDATIPRGMVRDELALISKRSPVLYLPGLANLRYKDNVFQGKDGRVFIHTNTLCNVKFDSSKDAYKLLESYQRFFRKLLNEDDSRASKLNLAIV